MSCEVCFFEGVLTGVVAVSVVVVVAFHLLCWRR